MDFPTILASLANLRSSSLAIYIFLAILLFSRKSSRIMLFFGQSPAILFFWPISNDYVFPINLMILFFGVSLSRFVFSWPLFFHPISDVHLNNHVGASQSESFTCPQTLTFRTRWPLPTFPSFTSDGEPPKPCPLEIGLENISL